MQTRDSLLGRQGVTGSPLVWYRLAVGADQTGISQIDAALTKAFAFPWHKSSRTFPDGIGKASGIRVRLFLQAGGYALSAPRTTIPEHLRQHKGGRWSTLHSRPFPLPRLTNAWRSSRSRSVVLALIGRDSGQDQSAQVGRPPVQHR